MNDLLTLMHDANKRLVDLDYKTKLLKEWCQQNALKINNSMPFVIVEYLKTLRRDLQSDLDNYYFLTKEKEEGK